MFLIYSGVHGYQKSFDTLAEAIVEQEKVATALPDLQFRILEGEFVRTCKFCTRLNQLVVS